MAKLKNREETNIKNIILDFDANKSDETIDFLTDLFWLRLNIRSKGAGLKVGKTKSDLEAINDSIRHLKKANISLSQILLPYDLSPDNKTGSLVDEKIPAYFGRPNIYIEKHIAKLETAKIEIPKYKKNSKLNPLPLAAVYATRKLAIDCKIHVVTSRTDALSNLGKFGIAIFEEIFENPPSWEHYDRLFIESDFKGDAWD